MLLGSSRSYPWLILEENGRQADDDDDPDDDDDDDDDWPSPIPSTGASKMS